MGVLTLGDVIVASIIAAVATKIINIFLDARAYANEMIAKNGPCMTLGDLINEAEAAGLSPKSKIFLTTDAIDKVCIGTLDEIVFGSVMNGAKLNAIMKVSTDGISGRPVFKKNVAFDKENDSIIIKIVT